MNIVVHASILALALLFSACASTQPPARSVKPLTIADEVKAMETTWARAMTMHDYEALDRILGEEFRLHFVDRPGALPREAWLANLENMTFGPVSMADQEVTMQGENVAVVRMRMTLVDWMWGENRIPPKNDLTDTWVLRDGRWQVVSRISEPLEEWAPAGEDMPGEGWD